MPRTTALILALVLLAAPAAAQFNFGVSPSSITLTNVQPGTANYSQFYLISSSDRDIEVSVERTDGDIGDIRRLKPGAVQNFSAQPCGDCIEFLQAGGRLTERDEALDPAGTIRRWRQVRFFVSPPDDIEPGYHVIGLTPRPRGTGQAGSVGLVSTAAVPLVFRVPGEAVRSGRVIGMRTGERTPTGQDLVATFYNTGTVTMRVSARFIVPGTGGNTTHAAGSRLVAPGEEARFSARVDADRLNGSTPVTAAAAYGTGDAAMTRPVTAKQEVAVTGRTEQRAQPLTRYILLGVFLVISTIVTWRVVRRVR